jgi:hypothetical protein
MSPKLNAIIAKNLLQGKTCYNCIFKVHGICLYDHKNRKHIPEEKTCDKWEEQIILFGINPLNKNNTFHPQQTR